MLGNARRLALQQIDRATAPPPVPELPAASVKTTSPLAITYNGATITSPRVKHLAAYTPVAGDEVALVRWRGIYLILGKPV